MLQGLAIFIGSIATILYLVHYLIRGGRKGYLIDKIPGPYAWPIIGNVPSFIGPLDRIWNVLQNLNDNYYAIHRVWFGPEPLVILAHPDDVEVCGHRGPVDNIMTVAISKFPMILLRSSTHTDKSIFYKFLNPWLGTGLLTSSGEKWHQRRKILTPAFHFSMLHQFTSIFVNQSDEMVESLCPGEEKVVDDLVALLCKYTLHSICETAMGSTYNMDAKVLNEYASCVHEMGHLLIHRAVRPWLYLDWLFRYSKRYVDQCRALNVLHAFSTNIIKERKQYHEDTNGQHLEGLGSDESIYGYDDHLVSGKRSRRLAMLDLLISASQQDGKINDEGIREEVDTFVFEGHDTTTMGLCFALLLLAEHREIQEKVKAEVDEVFGERRGEEISIRDIQRLSYLERCIKESLRLFPSVPLISRRISGDLQLKKYLVPVGTIVKVHIYNLHRDPNFWPNPTVFDPDRFLPDNTQGRHPFAFVPFSAGPRNCIGQKFAMLESKALIAHLIRKFYLEPIDLSSRVQIMSDMVLRPMTPIRMKLVRRC